MLFVGTGTGGQPKKGDLPMSYKTMPQALVPRANTVPVMRMIRAAFLRSCAAIVALLPAAACNDGGDVAGQYIPLKVDGIPASEYAMEDSAGRLVTAAEGGLDLCGDGRYRMNVMYSDESGQQVVVVSSGDYERDGVVLTLIDSGGRALLTASVSGGLITVSVDGHEFELLRLVQLPPFAPPDCGPVAGG